MFRQSTFALVLWVLATALLPVRMANAHLHLCLDGKEPPVTMHVFDVPTLADIEHAAEGHEDRDVQVSTSFSINKSAGVDDVGLTLATAYTLAILLPVQDHIAPIDIDLVQSHEFPLELLPPLRGPPL